MAINPLISLQAVTPGDLQAQTDQHNSSMANIANQKFNQNMQTQEFDYKKKQYDLEAAKTRLDILGQAIGSAVDQNTYSSAKNFLKSNGFDVDSYPDIYDPQIVRQAGQMTLSAKDKVLLEQQKFENQFGREKFEEDKRHNQATERVAADNSDIRGQLADIKMMQAENPRAKPIPPASLKLMNEDLESIGAVGNVNADLKALVGEIDGGNLKFGPVQNLIDSGRNAVGASTPQSRNKSTFNATLERLRNESLRLNKGVQTDGDAQRAWNELLQNTNDTTLVKQRLEEIQKINERGAQLKQLNVDQIRSNYGADPLDYSQYTASRPALGGQSKQNGLTPTGQARVQSLESNPQAIQIRDQLRAGQISPQQARQQLEALK